MATVLQVILPKSSVLLCFFLWTKDSMKRIFLKKCFLFTVGSVCRVKRFTAGSRNSLKDVRKSQMMSTVFWDSQGVLLAHFQKRGGNVNSASHCHIKASGCNSQKTSRLTGKRGAASS
jgi:hypothetical protein